MTNTPPPPPPPPGGGSPPPPPPGGGGAPQPGGGSSASSPTPGEIVILAAGAVALIGSFVNVFGSGRFGISGWSSGLFPLFTLIPLYAVIMAVHVALTRFANVNLPERVLDLTWEQIHLVLGFFAALMALAWLISGTRFQAGFWLVFLGAAAALVGAVMLQKERSTGAIG